MRLILCLSPFVLFGFRLGRPNNQTNISCILSWPQEISIQNTQTQPCKKAAKSAAFKNISNLNSISFLYKSLMAIAISPTLLKSRAKRWQSQIPLQPSFMDWWCSLFSLLWATACMRQVTPHWRWITMPKLVPMCCRLWGKRWSVQCFLTHVMQLLLSDCTSTTALSRFISSFNSLLFWYIFIIQKYLISLYLSLHFKFIAPLLIYLLIKLSYLELWLVFWVPLVNHLVFQNWTRFS